MRNRFRPDENDAVIAVSDRGIGICQEEQVQLFQPVSRTARSGEVASGQGHGLYISAEMVKADGGTIKIESQTQRESTFSVRLPRSR